MNSRSSACPLRPDEEKRLESVRATRCSMGVITSRKDAVAASHAGCANSDECSALSWEKKSKTWSTLSSCNSACGSSDESWCTTARISSTSDMRVRSHEMTSSLNVPLFHAPIEGQKTPVS